jgi:hypothetical protein
MHRWYVSASLVVLFLLGSIGAYLLQKARYERRWKPAESSSFNLGAKDGRLIQLPPGRFRYVVNANGSITAGVFPLKQAQSASTPNMMCGEAHVRSLDLECEVPSGHVLLVKNDVEVCESNVAVKLAFYDPR